MELTKNEKRMLNGNKLNIRVSFIMGIIMVTIAVALIPFSRYQIKKAQNIWALNYELIKTTEIISETESRLKSYALDATGYVMKEWVKNQEEKVLRIFALFFSFGCFFISHAIRERTYSKIIDKLLNSADTSTALIHTIEEDQSS